jgi:hypothetical protein
MMGVPLAIARVAVTGRPKNVRLTFKRLFDEKNCIPSFEWMQGHLFTIVLPVACFA